MPSYSLSLPERFVVLAHPAWKPRLHVRLGTAAAELAELSLLGRISVDAKRIHLLDATPTGLHWGDALLAEWSGSDRPTKLQGWLRSRTSFAYHQQKLVGDGVLSVQPKKFLGVVPYDIHVASPHVQGEVWQELKTAVSAGHHPDSRVVMLGGLVHASHMGRTLGFDRKERAVLRSFSDGHPLTKAVRKIIDSQAAAGAATAGGAAAAGGASC